MRKYLILVLLIVPCLALSSLNIGLGANVSFLLETEKEDSSSAYSLDTLLIPSLHLMISPQIEILPFIGIGFSKESDPDAISTAGWQADYSQLMISAGAGFFYHFINREIVSLSTGPRLALFLNLAPSGTSATVYDSYFNLVTRVGLPIYLDVQLKQRLFLRTGIEVFGVEFDFWKQEEAGVTSSGTTFAIKDYILDPLGSFQGWVGFIFML